MANVSSNLAEIAGYLNGLADTLRLTRRPRGSSRNVGGQVLDMTAVIIEHRTAEEQLDPDDTPLAPLSPVTIARKVRLGYPTTIGIETHRMLDLAEIRGQQDVSDRSASMTYGVDADARRKAEAFTEGNPRQPPRPFFDLGNQGERLLDDFIEDTIIADQIEALS